MILVANNPFLTASRIINKDLFALFSIYQIGVFYTKQRPQPLSYSLSYSPLIISIVGATAFVFSALTKIILLS